MTWYDAFLQADGDSSLVPFFRVIGMINLSVAAFLCTSGESSARRSVAIFYNALFTIVQLYNVLTNAYTLAEDLNVPVWVLASIASCLNPI